MTKSAAGQEHERRGDLRRGPRESTGAREELRPERDDTPRTKVVPW